MKTVVQAVRRNFIRLKPAAQQYIKLGSFDFGDEYEIEVSWATTNTKNQVLLGDSHTSTYYLNISNSIAWWSNGNAYSFDPGAVTIQDGLLHTLRVISTPTTIRMVLDGIELQRLTSSSYTPYPGVVNNVLLGSSNSNPTTFDGYISDLKIWAGGDKESGDLINEWRLDDTLEDSIIRSSTVVEGPEIVINGDFGGGMSDWAPLRGASLSSGNGQITIVNGDAGFGGTFQPITLEVGEKYIVSADYTHVNGSGFLMISGSNNLGNPRLLEVEVATEDANFTQVFTATHATAYIGVAQGSTATPGTISRFSNITVKKLTGGTYGTAVNMDSSDSELFEEIGGLWSGPELLENGGFDEPSGWNVPASASINNGACWFDNSTAEFLRASLLDRFESGCRYRSYCKLEHEVKYDRRFRLPYDGSVSNIKTGVFGENDFRFIAGGSGSTVFIGYPNGYTGRLDDVSIRKILEVAV
ncbi:MAG: LamG domain-containing protein [Oceanobacter sp.]